MEDGRYGLTNGENAAATRMENDDSPTTFYGRFGDIAAVKPNSNEDQSETAPSLPSTLTSYAPPAGCWKLVAEHATVFIQLSFGR
jgi:hypothetical protein